MTPFRSHGSDGKAVSARFEKEKVIRWHVRFRWLGCVAAFGIAGCAIAPPRAVNRYVDASAGAAEMIAKYEGKTHAELLKIKDEPVAQRFRKNGHRYRVILMVQADVEHPPDGLQASFTVFDDDREATMTPVDRTFYLRAGESLKTAR